MIRSLGVIIALSLAGLQLLAVVLVVFSSYFTSERTLLVHARNQMFDVGTNVIQHTKGFLTPAKSAAELSTALAENKIVRREEIELLEGLLFQQLRSAPQFAGAFYGDEDGNFVYVKREGDNAYLTKVIDANAEIRTTLIERDEEFSKTSERPDPNDTYDPRVRPWYKAAKEDRGSIWTDPYIFFTARSPGITAATPVVGYDGDVQGVIGVDIEIKALSSFLSDLRIGQNGAAFILNRNGDVIAHPNPDLLTRTGEDGVLVFPSIDQVADPVARAAFGGHMRGKEVVIDEAVQGSFLVDGTDYMSLIMPFGLGEVPWTIVVYAPEEDFIGTLKDNRAQNTLIAIGVAAATGLLGLALASRIYAPVRAFAVRSALISQGEVDPNEPMPGTYRELENANTTLVNEISQRKKTESEYRLTFDMASRGMVYIDSASGKLLRVNARFAQMLGYGKEELDGVVFQSLLHKDEPDVLQSFDKGRAGHAAFSFEAQAVRKSGETIWISFNGVFFRSDEDSDYYIVATIDDITQARASEETIEALNREIAHVSRRQVMGELATGLAHELNQPLTAITQNADAAMFLVAHRKDAARDVHALLEEIDQQAHQAGDIIRALRGFIRKEGNKATDFDIRELLEQGRRLVLREARLHSVDIVIAPGPELVVRSVRVQIAQVVVNLMRNAIEAIAETDDKQRRIEVSARQIGTTVQVDVADSGPGIKDGLELFAQFETTKHSGMGLGLSICRSLIEANGGRIWGENTDIGARFSFTLPLEEQNNG